MPFELSKSQNCLFGEANFVAVFLLAVATGLLASGNWRPVGSDRAREVSQREAFPSGPRSRSTAGGPHDDALLGGFWRTPWWQLWPGPKLVRAFGAGSGSHGDEFEVVGLENHPSTVDVSRCDADIAGVNLAALAASVGGVDAAGVDTAAVQSVAAGAGAVQVGRRPDASFDRRNAEVEAVTLQCVQSLLILWIVVQIQRFGPPRFRRERIGRVEGGVVALPAETPGSQG